MTQPGFLDPLERARTRVGTLLCGKWRLDRVLGVGGMAAVYAATHRNGSRGAVKLLHPELSTDADTHRRFLREGLVANQVDHPGVVRVLDDDTDPVLGPFLVMELLDGESVEAFAARNEGERLPEATVREIARDLCAILGAAHAKGIVHRDIKPENLFLTTKGQLKILDFGIARIREGVDSARATRAGTLMGTPAFMPPEQALGHVASIDARSDVWAVGATLFTLLTGAIVHEDETPQKVLLAAMTKPARPLRSIAPWVSTELAAVIDRAMRFEREHRYEDCAAMRAALTGAPDGAIATGATMISGRPSADPDVGNVTPITRELPPSVRVYAPGAARGTDVTQAVASPRPPQQSLGRRIVVIAASITLVACCLSFWFLRVRHRPSMPDGSPELATSPVEAIAVSRTTEVVPEPTTAATTDTGKVEVPVVAASSSSSPIPTARSPRPLPPRPTAAASAAATAAPSPPTAAPAATDFKGRF